MNPDPSQATPYDDLALRLASDHDLEYLYQVMEITMRGYVEATWGAWIENRVRLEMAVFLSSGNARIVQRGGADCGLLIVDQVSTHIQLEQICLSPETQRQGIGSYLVRQLQNEATDRRVPLRLRVLRPNPAHRLYGRLGFSVTNATAERLFMEWLPDRTSS